MRGTGFDSQNHKKRKKEEKERKRIINTKE
jgi:hypothetical protein